MTYSHFDPAAQNRVPWNFGAKIGPKRPFNQKQIWAIRFFLDREERMRDRGLFDLAIDSKLRGCDLVELKIGDLVSGPEIRTRATITQRKTGRPVEFEIVADARASLFAWLELRGGGVEEFVFPSRVDATRHLSTRQYARLVDEWVTAIGLRPEEYGSIATPNQGFDHLQSHRQHQSDSDVARSLQNRKHRSLSRCRHRRRSYTRRED